MADVQPTSDQYADEQWKPVPGWEGYYEVSSKGRIRGMSRDIVTRTGLHRHVKGSMMSPRADKWGHISVALSTAGHRTWVRVHVAVLEAFVSIRPDGMLGCHNDGNPANNDVSNLRWDTPSSNNEDTIAHGHHRNLNKTHCKRGHLLAAPNLVESMLKKGRSCRSCQRAHSMRISVHDKEDFQRVSDSVYQYIMGDLLQK